MFDAASPSDRTGLQRAVGAVRVAFKRRGDATVLDRLHQSGCLKARLPRVDPGEWTTAVTLNTSGGIAGGDRLDLAFDQAPATRATITAQAAERFYRAMSGGGPATIRTRIGIAPGAACEWLPQETILFDGFALDRSLDIDLAPDSHFLATEILVFGRTAMGERVTAGWLRDRIRVRRGGGLLWQDAIRLDGDIDAQLQRPGIGGGNRCIASVLAVAPTIADRLEDVRQACADCEAGASAWDGLLVARLMAPDSAMLRRHLIAVLDVLRGGRALPRMWNC